VTVDTRKSRLIESSSQVNRRPSAKASGRLSINLRENGLPTDEEDMLSTLLATDEALQEVLSIYGNLEKIAIDKKAVG
jgi:hypothetical protein